MTRFKIISIVAVFFLVSTVLTILQGCAGIGSRLEPPKISLAHISVEEAKAFETAFQLDLRVFNFNDVPLEIKAIDCELEINGKNLAKGVSATRTTVPPFGTEVVQMKVYSSMLGMVSSMLDMIRRAQTNPIEPKLDYKVSGRLRIGGDSALPLSIPFKTKGELNLEGITTGGTPR